MLSENILHIHCPLLMGCRCLRRKHQEKTTSTKVQKSLLTGKILPVYLAPAKRLALVMRGQQIRGISKETAMKKGFTLTELLMVMLIIGILSAIAIPQYSKIVEKGRFTKAAVMAKAFYDSCERYVSEWGVDNYDDLPSNLQNVSRMDIGSENLLPAGFRLRDGEISGAGFTYELTGRGCEVKITRTKAGAYKDTVLTFTGSSFVCKTDKNGACDIYGTGS